MPEQNDNLAPLEWKTLSDAPTGGKEKAFFDYARAVIKNGEEAGASAHAIAFDLLNAGKFEELTESALAGEIIDTASALEQHHTEYSYENELAKKKEITKIKGLLEEGK